LSIAAFAAIVVVAGEKQLIPRSAASKPIALKAMSKADSTASRIKAARAAMGLPTRPVVRPAKVGSQPWCIVLRGGCRPKVGRLLTFRRAEHGYRWVVGRVTKIDTDGHLFIDLE
jgi:hypothetical protein